MRNEVVRPDSQRPSLLIDLVYELLDAHSDTVALASDIRDPDWEAHTDYVRALQRRGRLRFFGQPWPRIRVLKRRTSPSTGSNMH